MGGQSYEKLTVVDVYKKWSGPTEVILPVFDWIFINVPDADKKVSYFSIEQDDITEWFDSSSAKVVPPNYGCRPLFAFFKDEQLITTVKGANAPDITRIVKENLVAA